MSAVVIREETKLTATGQWYRVWHDGEVLVENTRYPFGDAARALVDKGVTGRIQMKRKVSDIICLEGLIAVSAALTVTEGQDSSVRVVKYVPHFAAADEAAQ